MINRTLLKNIRPELQQAVDAVLKKHGLEGQFGSMSFTDSDFTVKLSVNQIGGKSRKDSRQAIQFQMHAESYGLKPEMLDKPQITIDGATLIITGYNNQKKKYPFMVTLNGQSYKMTANHIKAQLAI